MARLFRKIAHAIPGLQLKLRQAGMPMKPEKFVRQTFLSALYMTVAICAVVFAFFSRFDVPFTSFPVVVVFTLVLLFFYFLRLPDVKIIKETRSVNREVIDAGRFLIVELESGVSLYDSLYGVARNFDHIGKHFQKLIDNIDTGTSIEQAINDAIEAIPSWDLRRILWQIFNSLKTGSDIGTSLREVVEQTGRKHLIEIRRYGRKLNPLAMFYMIISVIVPSLGITMLVVFASFLSLQIDLLTLMVFVFAIGFIQFAFIAIIKNSRPAVNM